MPLGHKNAGVIVAEVEMERRVRDCAVLVVEGPDDIRFWDSRKYSECELVDGEGKPNVVEAVQRLDRMRVRGVLGVIDDDYDCLMGVSIDSANIVAVVPHDLESFLCQSTALDKVLAEFGEPSKIKWFENNEGVDIRTGLLDRAGVFGTIRWATLWCDLEIDLGQMRIPRFVDPGTWGVDRQALMQVMAGDSEEGLRDCIDRLPEVEPWRIVRGHDVLEVLRIGLQKVLGDLKASVGVREIARVLRSAGELDGTEVFERIRRWEKVNRPYQVLRS